jgi:hypothetical protein
VSTTRGGSRVAGGNDSRLRRLMPPWENRGERATGERQIAPRGASRCVRRPAPTGDLDSDRKTGQSWTGHNCRRAEHLKKGAPTALAQSPQGACPALRNRAIPAEIRPAARTAKPPEQAQRVSDAWEVSLRGLALLNIEKRGLWSLIQRHREPALRRRPRPSGRAPALVVGHQRVSG